MLQQQQLCLTCLGRKQTLAQFGRLAAPQHPQRDVLIAQLVHG
jgi:hypothetical protein